MPGLIVLRGLPGSGKTTLVLEQVNADPDRRVRVSRDKLRETLHGRRLGTRTQEEQVTVAQDLLIAAYLRAGLDVYTDATNLDPDHVTALQDLAFSCGANLGVIDLTDVPVDVCVDQDRARGKRGGRMVGEAVIRQMHAEWVAGRGYPLPMPPHTVIEKYVDPGPDCPNAILVDLDGTLCDRGDRSPYDETRVGQDAPVEVVVEAALMYQLLGSYEVIFMSGRSELCRADTEEWLRTHYPAPWRHLLMRPAGDGRRDSIVKRELFDRHVRNHFRVRVVLDDRNQVVSMWRQLGLTVFQVADGNF